MGGGQHSISGDERTCNGRCSSEHQAKPARSPCAALLPQQASLPARPAPHLNTVPTLTNMEAATAPIIAFCMPCSTEHKKHEGREQSVMPSRQAQLAG